MHSTKIFRKSLEFQPRFTGGIVTRKKKKNEIQCGLIRYGQITNDDRRRFEIRTPSVSVQDRIPGSRL